MQLYYLQPGVAKRLVHAKALPHLHLQQVVDQVSGCGRDAVVLVKALATLAVEWCSLQDDWSFLFCLLKMKACLCLICPHSDIKVNSLAVCKLVMLVRHW